MNKPIRFGILGLGKIANRFCDSLQTLPGDAEVFAVASREGARAIDFSVKYNAKRIYHSYEELVRDADVDIIYIATPHAFHLEHGLLCLSNGKPVLCEKPMTLSAIQTKQLVDMARTKKVFLMEAMWSRFIPALIKVKETIDAGVIGDVKFMHADFGFIAPDNLAMRTYNKSLGGGAQLDVGVYPMFLALWLLGKPETIHAHASLASTGVDSNTTAMLGYASGAAASIYSSFVTDSPKEAVITGTKGSITIHSAWHKATAFTLRKNNADPELYEFPYPSNGLQFQAMEAIQCLREGKTESSKLPLSMSISMAETADAILKRIAVNY